jgi:hypothetical protein
MSCTIKMSTYHYYLLMFESDMLIARDDMFSVTKCSNRLRLFIYNFFEIKNVWQHMFTSLNEYEQLMISILNSVDLIECLIVVSFSINYCNHDRSKNTIEFDVIVHSIIVCIAVLSENDSCMRRQWIEMSFDAECEFQLYEFSQNVILESRDRSLIENSNHIFVEFMTINVIQIVFILKENFWVDMNVVISSVIIMICVKKSENEWWFNVDQLE